MSKLDELFDGKGWHIEKPIDPPDINLEKLKKTIEEEYERLHSGFDNWDDWIDSIYNDEEE